jgi:hypothetical protein
VADLDAAPNASTPAICTAQVGKWAADTGANHAAGDIALTVSRT